MKNSVRALVQTDMWMNTLTCVCRRVEVTGGGREGGGMVHSMGWVQGQSGHGEQQLTTNCLVL